MVLDREAVENPIALKFSYEELEAILAAMRDDGDIRKRTIAKMEAIVTFARTRQAYYSRPTTLTVS